MIYIVKRIDCGHHNIREIPFVHLRVIISIRQSLYYQQQNNTRLKNDAVGQEY